MTTLEAVNQMLEAMGEPPVIALPGSYDGSNEGRAMSMLGTQRKRILSEGWFINELGEQVFNFASVQLTGTIATGSFKQGETVVQDNTDASGIIVESYTTTHTVYLICPDDESPAFNGSDNITGQSSGTSTDTISDTQTLSDGVIQLPYETLAATPLHAQGVSLLGDKGLFDLRRDTEVFDRSITLALTVDIDFESLPPEIANYVTAEAAMRLQKAIKRGTVDDQFAERDLYVAKSRALQFVGDMRQTDLTTTRQARFMKGRRRRYVGR